MDLSLPKLKPTAVVCKLKGWKNAASSPGPVCKCVCKKSGGRVAGMQAHWFFPGKQVCRHPGCSRHHRHSGPPSWFYETPGSNPPLSPPPAPPGAGALLVNAFLFDQRTFISRVEWDSPWGIIGCQIWHLLLLQKNRPNAMHRVSEPLPSTETRQSAKLLKGEQGFRGGRGSNGD